MPWCNCGASDPDVEYQKRMARVRVSHYIPCPTAPGPSSVASRATKVAKIASRKPSPVPEAEPPPEKEAEEWSASLDSHQRRVVAKAAEATASIFLGEVGMRVWIFKTEWMASKERDPLRKVAIRAIGEFDEGKESHRVCRSVVQHVCSPEWLESEMYMENDLALNMKPFHQQMHREV